MLNPRPFAQREFTARTSRERFIESDLRLLPFQPRRFNPRQLAAANALSNPLLLIPLTRVDAVPAIAPSSLRQSRRRNHCGHQRRHCTPFHQASHITSLISLDRARCFEQLRFGGALDKTEVNRVRSRKVSLKIRPAKYRRLGSRAMPVIVEAEAENERLLVNRLRVEGEEDEGSEGMKG